TSYRKAGAEATSSLPLRRTTGICRSPCRRSSSKVSSRFESQLPPAITEFEKCCSSANHHRLPAVNQRQTSKPIGHLFRSSPTYLRTQILTRVDIPATPLAKSSCEI